MPRSRKMREFEPEFMVVVVQKGNFALDTADKEPGIVIFPAEGQPSPIMHPKKDDPPYDVLTDPVEYVQDPSGGHCTSSCPIPPDAVVQLKPGDRIVAREGALCVWCLLNSKFNQAISKPRPTIKACSRFSPSAGRHQSGIVQLDQGLGKQSDCLHEPRANHAGLGIQPAGSLPQSIARRVSQLAQSGRDTGGSNARRRARSSASTRACSRVSACPAAVAAAASRFAAAAYSVPASPAPGHRLPRATATRARGEPIPPRQRAAAQAPRRLDPPRSPLAIRAPRRYPG